MTSATCTQTALSCPSTWAVTSIPTRASCLKNGRTTGNPWSFLWSRYLTEEQLLSNLMTPFRLKESLRNSSGFPWGGCDHLCWALLGLRPSGAVMLLWWKAGAESPAAAFSISQPLPLMLCQCCHWGFQSSLGFLIYFLHGCNCCPALAEVSTQAAR